MPVKIMQKLRHLIARFLSRQRMSGLSNVKKYFHQTLGRNKNNEYTKMVKAINKRKKSVVDNDPIRKRMVKEREEHAKQQNHDYSHVFRKKSTFDLIRLSLIITGLEFAYSAETAFVSPILLSIGIEHKHMTLVWAISPILGFFLSPIMGSLSDRCRSRFGRRRPLIILLSLGILGGLVLAPWGRDIGAALGDVSAGSAVANITNDDPLDLEYKTVNLSENPNSFFYAILFTVVGTLLLDFSADNCQNPARAYLLDVCLPEEHAHALSTFTIMAGVGGSFGYALGAINWDQTIFSNFIGDNIKTVFTIVTVLFIVATTITITSFREIPLRLLETDEKLRPVTQMEVKKEKERLKANDLNKSQTTISTFVADEASSSSKDNADAPTKSYMAANSRETSISVSSSDDDDDEGDESITLVMYLKSIIFMPKSLRILCLTNCLSWMGHIVYCLYFTDFVGESVFGGDPAAPIDSPEYDLYDQGIRFGCWGMTVYALACAFYSMIIEKVIKRFTAKRAFVGAMLLYAVAMAILGHYPTKIGVLVFSTTAGIIYATLFTVPYLLVAQYHGKGTFKVKKPDNNNMPEKVEPPTVEFERGLGTDCGIVGSMMFVAQFVMSLSIGSFITLIGDTAAVLYAASFFSLLAAVSACYVVYMDL